MKSPSLSTKIVALIAIASAAYAGTVTLAWDPNTETNIAGYRLYFGTNGFQNMVDCGNVTNRIIENLRPGRWSFYATCYNTSGLESEPSNIVEWQSIGDQPSTPTNLRLRP